MLREAMMDGANDPVKELVLKFLLSYGGLVGGVSFLLEGLKMLFKNFVSGREPILVIVLSFFLGASAKLLMVDVYGPNTRTAWGLHLLILVFVAVGAAAFHDKFLAVLTSFMPGKPPGGSGGSLSGNTSAGASSPDQGSNGPGNPTKSDMKPLKLALIAFTLILSMTGCALFHNPDAAFVTGVDAGLNSGAAGAGILDKYEAYVDADSKLTADTKRIEHSTVARLRKLIADAKGK